jgi:hypothetical protein
MNTEQNTVPENKAKQKPILELLIILVFSIAIYIFAASYDILERVVAFSRQHENWELDEFITVSFFIVFALAFFSVRRWKEVRNARNVLLQRHKDLQKALSEIKQLRGIIPICAACKKIRDDEGFWHQVESYVRDHTEAEFSHSICPECMKKLYPEFVEKE